MASCECVPVVYKENITPVCTKSLDSHINTTKSSSSFPASEGTATSLSSSSAAATVTVTIDSFTIPKWDELPVLCWSNELTQELNQPPGPEDAIGLFTLITKLRSVLKYHTEIYRKSAKNDGSTNSYTFMDQDQDPTLIAATIFLTKEISSLRSAISRHATIASTELVHTAGNSIIRFTLPSVIDNFINTLLIRSSSDKKFIKLEAESTLKILANLQPSTSSLLLSYLRHSSSKSRVMSTFSAELANCCLPHIPPSDVLQLDLAHISSLVAAYITSKSAEARSYANQLSSTFSRIRGIEAWSTSVQQTCKPIEAVGLLKHLIPSTVSTSSSSLSLIEGVIDESSSNHHLSSIHSLTNGSNSLSLMTSPPKRVVPLYEYLREQRSSQKKRQTMNTCLTSPSLPTVNMLASPVPLTTFSPGIIPVSSNPRRISKSPVLVLKRQSIVSTSSDSRSSITENSKYVSTIIETPIDSAYNYENIPAPVGKELRIIGTPQNLGSKKWIGPSPSTPVLSTPTRVPLTTLPSGGL